MTLAAAVGGHRASRDEYFEGWQVHAKTIECSVADLMALVRATAQATGNDEYGVRVSINWTDEQPIKMVEADMFGDADDSRSTPLHRFTPVEATMNAAESDIDYHWQAGNRTQVPGIGLGTLDRLRK